MAYIRCTSCQKTVSSKASKCPYCNAEIRLTDAKMPVSEGTPKRTQKKKTSTTPTREEKKYKLPDKTASYTAKRFILHTIVSLIGYGIAFLLGGLVIDILEKLFAPALVLSTLKHTRAFLTGFALVVAMIAGGFGPIGKGAYVYGLKESEFVRARALPLQWLSFAYLIPSIGSLVFYLISREKLMHVVESNLGTDKEILTLAISFSICVYYAVFTFGSFGRVMSSRCPQCLHIDCKRKCGESAHTHTSETQQRERKVAGASYDVYTTSGTHVGTVQGPDSTVTESRTVTTESWNVSWQCIHCGYRGTTAESSVSKSKWN